MRGSGACAWGRNDERATIRTGATYRRIGALLLYILEPTKVHLNNTQLGRWEIQMQACFYIQGWVGSIGLAADVLFYLLFSSSMFQPTRSVP